MHGANGVDWADVERKTIAESISEHGQPPSDVADVLCQHSPGAISKARQDEVRALVDEQYSSHAYQRLLRQFGMQLSMSRKGNCWDNAPMESYWGSLKNELVHHRRFATRADAKREITEYIEIFYNRIRKQARLGYLSPAAFMQKHYEKTGSRLNVSVAPGPS